MREEALVREARRLGLERSDELVRRRISFDGAYAWGDRFVYDRDCVERYRVELAEGITGAPSRAGGAPERVRVPGSSADSRHSIAPPPAS